jgi:phosphoglycolate phosphatase
LEFTKEQTKLFTKYYDKACIEDVVLFDGIEDAIKSYAKQYKMYIATNASDNFAYKILENLNILEYFDKIIGANNVKNPKPKPDMLEKILSDYNYDNKDVVLVGDSQKDELSAKNANIKFILVDWSKADTIDKLIKQIDEI